jgi:hypothetical protein
MTTTRTLLLLAAVASLDPIVLAPAPALTVRNAHAMAYDSKRGRVVLFGGADEKGVRGDLWEWDGSAWRLLAADGPSPRTFPALAYDRARERLVLFGGNRVLFGTADDGDDTFLNDTWEWDGGAWHCLPGAMPPARAEASVAYDAARHRVVLFGGYRKAHGELVRLGDTWEWDGSAWKALDVSGPSARSGAAIAYDPRRRRVVLFGGNDANAETWEWVGTGWRVLDAPTPGRFNCAMAYDASRRRVIRFGGVSQGVREAETWELDGTRWQRVAGPGPEGRNHSAMAYDERRKVLVLFGGHDGERVFGDTWERRLASWSRSAHVPAVPHVDNGH